MKKMAFVFLLVLIVLSGCNTRTNIEPLTLDGTYRLVDFISSNINIQAPVHNPFNDNYQRTIEILENTVTIRDEDTIAKTVTEHVFTITLDTGYYVEMTHVEDAYTQKLYYDIAAGMLEMVESGTEKKHFIFSKLETPKKHLLKNGTYEIHAAFGYANGQLVKLELWEQFELNIQGSKITLIKKTVGGPTETNQGTYKGGIIGIETNMGDYVEYLTYDPSELTLTYTEKYYSVNQPQLNRDYYYIFKLKS